MIWFTADEHYGHTNIIRYCNRPFGSVEAMNEAIINRHNDYVGKKDTVYHLGDFALCHPTKVLAIIKQLNGLCHHFLPGSHDRWIQSFGNVFKRKHPYTLSMQIQDLTVQDEEENRQRLILCHYPMRSWPASFHGSWHLHGHVHGRMRKNRLPRTVDVGVDNWNFYPVSMDDVSKICVEDDLMSLERTP